MPKRVADEIAALPEPRGPLRRPCADLSRRVRLLAPLLDHLPAAAAASSALLADALGAAQDCLRKTRDSSKREKELEGDEERVPLCLRKSKGTRGKIVISSAFTI
ncbi:hypothetical protein E2562_010715 [Oryza meyeriana var. granulata]|uniref:Uncharacterized protein n=1 Tax=Oryza meyeriana var. granulata TaxID=110450 RepID=A0A6G1EW54_9ORYZ|nr:hypothetical protein E2562_010715 [Oryza meyeriana var. granulata]